MNTNSISNQVNAFMNQFQRELPKLDYDICQVVAHIFFQSIGDLEGFKKLIAHSGIDPKISKVAIDIMQKNFQHQYTQNSLKRKREEDVSNDQPKRLCQSNPIDLLNKGEHFEYQQEKILKFISLVSTDEIISDTDLENSFNFVIELLKSDDEFLVLEAARCLNFLSSKNLLSKEFTLRALPIVLKITESANDELAEIAWLCLGHFCEINLHVEIEKLALWGKIQENISFPLSSKEAEASAFFLRQSYACLLRIEPSMYVDFLLDQLSLFSLWDEKIQEAALLNLHNLACELSFFIPYISQKKGNEIVDFLFHTNREIAVKAIDLFLKTLDPNENFKHIDVATKFLADNRVHVSYNLADLNFLPKFSADLYENYQENAIQQAIVGLTIFLQTEMVSADLLEHQEIQKKAMHCLMILFALDRKNKSTFEANNGMDILFKLAQTAHTSSASFKRVLSDCLLILARDPDEKGIEKYYDTLFSLLPKACDYKLQSRILAALCHLADLSNEQAMDITEERENTMLSLMMSPNKAVCINAMYFFLESMYSYSNACLSDLDFSSKGLKNCIFWLLGGDQELRNTAYRCIRSFFQICDDKDEAAQFIENLIDALRKMSSVSQEQFFTCMHVIFAMPLVKFPPLPVEEDNKELYVDSLFGARIVNICPDIEVHCGEKKIACHKNILATHSEYFLQLFSKWYNDKAPVDLNEVHPDKMLSIINWMYGDKISFSTIQEVIELAKVADKYVIEKLKANCIAILKSQVSTRTAADILTCALHLSSEELQHHVMVWMMKNYPFLNFELTKVFQENWEAFQTLLIEEMKPFLIDHIFLKELA